MSTLDRAAVEQALAQYQDPYLKTDLLSCGCLRRLEISGGQVEAANCLRVLLEGDTSLQAVAVEEGMLPLVGKMLKDKSMQEAATRLFGGLDDCFEDMVAAAK